VNESGQTWEAEARNNLSQDGDAVYTHVQDAGETRARAQVLASRQECQEGRCGCLGRLLFFEVTLSVWLVWRLFSMHGR
jgi:exosome complex RNA-binding protein Csl4